MQWSSTVTEQRVLDILRVFFLQQVFVSARSAESHELKCSPQRSGCIMGLTSQLFSCQVFVDASLRQLLPGSAIPAISPQSHCRGQGSYVWEAVWVWGGGVGGGGGWRLPSELVVLSGLWCYRTLTGCPLSHLPVKQPWPQPPLRDPARDTCGSFCFNDLLHACVCACVFQLQTCLVFLLRVLQTSGININACVRYAAESDLRAWIRGSLKQDTGHAKFPHLSN